MAATVGPRDDFAADEAGVDVDDDVVVENNNFLPADEGQLKNLPAVAVAVAVAAAVAGPVATALAEKSSRVAIIIDLFL
eukprot:CAMPEP_0113464092 /NCGR_PEP_ID=MMETSP0014_2-20120614/13014_1 /TAXON_ID=2857 /ORGANISM="Nitzschia sp." /LENGTH=78 /DNA_ID=CAMNT_0000356145 /DNA_START=779 /DNA_END=1015 /DNA_ORIENTATION=- /assembly_acc=CAM_ASM_000159